MGRVLRHSFHAPLDRHRSRGWVRTCSQRPAQRHDPVEKNGTRGLVRACSSSMQNAHQEKKSQSTLFRTTYHPQLGEKCRVTFQLTRVLIQVFSCSKLRRIDKNGRNNDIVGRPCLAHQRHVAIVQCTHGRDKTDCFRRIQGSADGSNGFHGSVQHYRGFGSDSVHRR